MKKASFTVIVFGIKGNRDPGRETIYDQKKRLEIKMNSAAGLL